MWMNNLSNVEVAFVNQVYTPEEKKAMGKAIRFLADMDQSFNGRVRPRWGGKNCMM